VFGHGLSGLDLSFSATGANSQSGVTTTDGSGVASFTYSGTAAGPDSIAASLFGITSNTVQAIWQGTTNHPPVANAGSDQIVEAISANGAVVNLIGSFSSDIDGNPLTYSWSGPFGTLTGISISPTLPLGQSNITLTVDDGAMHSSSSVRITVRDTTPPIVTPPAAITIAATEAGGVRAASSSLLSAFLSGGSARDLVDSAPARLSPLLNGTAIDSGTQLPINANSSVQFRFADASGNLGAASSSVSVILGQPRLYIRATGQGRLSSGGFYVDLQFTNTGTGNARNLSPAQFTFRTLSGSGNVSMNSPALPMLLGSLDVNASTTIRLLLIVPTTVGRFGIVENGTVNDVAGTGFTFSASQAVIP
jgi:hypothetical protein